MADSTTPIFNLVKPDIPGADRWGSKNNANFDKIDAAIFARNPRRMNTMVVAGDSLTNNGGGPGVNPATRVGAAWTWANFLLGHRIKVLRNAGIGGDTSTQLLARYSTDVLAYNPSWVHLLIGTNDAGVGTTAAVDLATTQSNMLSMIDKSFAQGSGIIVGTIPPRGQGNTNTRGTGAKAHALALNNWIRTTLPFLRPGIHVVDYHAVTADPASGDQWLSGYVQTDGTHWNSVGAFYAAQALAAVLTGLIPALPRVIRTPADAANIIPNALGQFAGAASGVAPTSWTTGSAPMVTGLEARTDGIPGNWLVVTVPAGGTFSMTRDITSATAVGDNLIAAVEHKATGIETPATPTVLNQSVSFGLLIGPTFSNALEFSQVNGSDQPHGNMDRAGILETPPYTRQLADTQIQVSINIKGGGTYRFANATVTKQ